MCCDHEASYMPKYSYYENSDTRRNVRIYTLVNNIAGCSIWPKKNLWTFKQNKYGAENFLSQTLKMIYHEHKNNIHKKHDRLILHYKSVTI